ncbi:MarR family winged helix-turn-helix transcriptional regulator [Ornithinibacillus contaminans]|uniref:MarR family winged helix-turn-helix transcriptional regulator n=1 Tax=Ornithinibacillus contaminans TaxID=694055 RepID=UPI00069EE893|nr:MarR family transcriptional regulator [Ornithinibacillus contaminans]
MGVPHRQLFYEYVSMYRPFLNELNEQLAPFRIHLSDWKILYFILREGGNTVSAISTHFKVEKPTITKIIQKLLELGYVEVITGTDRRVKVIQLTDEGQEICNQVNDTLDQLHEYLLEDVSEEEQLLVARVLQSISQKLGVNKG